MTKRLQPCLTCKPSDGEGGKFPLKRGFTRHQDRICSRCRQFGPPDRNPGRFKGRAA